MAPSNNSSIANTQYMANGVTISHSVPSVGDNVKISYDGILSKSGASDILAHVGFGNKWENLCEYKMTRTSTGFEANITIDNADSLNICFKDSANNWDNNSGMNYLFDIVQ